MKKIIPITLALLFTTSFAHADDSRPSTGTWAAGGCAAGAFGTTAVGLKLGLPPVHTVVIGCAGGALMGASISAASAEEAPSQAELNSDSPDSEE